MDQAARLRNQDRFTPEGPSTSAHLTQPAPDRFVARLAVDPATIRRQQAESGVEAASLLGKSPTPDAALRAHADETVTGTITLTWTPVRQGA